MVTSNLWEYGFVDVIRALGWIRHIELPRSNRDKREMMLSSRHCTPRSYGRRPVIDNGVVSSIP
jgi:hypothetical protein